MKKMNISTLLECLYCGDREINVLAENEILRRYGTYGLENIYNAFRENNIKYLSFLNPCCSSDTEDIQKIWNYITKQGRVQEKQLYLSDHAIYDLYHNSGSEKLRGLAKAQMVLSYQDFVYHIMRTRYDPYTKEYGEDLFQCGVVGLLKALELYDKNYAFTTYAKYYIIHEMYEHVNFLKHSPSLHYAQLQHKIKMAIERLQSEHLEPTVQRIAAITGISIKVVERELKVLNCIDFVYLDDMNNTVVNSLSFESDLEDYVEHKILMEDLSKFMNDLDQEAQNVVLLKVCDGISFEKIAKRLGISEGRVKFLYRKSMDCLRKKF